MNKLTDTLMPSATSMIRMDHTHVMATFHQFRAAKRPMVKQGLVNTTCLALEIHAQLEEEIFYPALREVTESEVMLKSVPEHNEMKRLIGVLREMKPDDSRYDETYMELMRDVLHHVADEETVLLPEAERSLQDQLGELGRRMTARRLQLLAPKAPVLAMNMAKSKPGLAIAMISGVVLLGALLGRRRATRSWAEEWEAAS